MKILILGGTSEASELVSLLAEHPEITATLSLAGRTRAPITPKASNIKTRIGGFGGAAGLANYLEHEEISALICATHPFARNMPFNAQEAAKIAGVPLIFILRPQWQAENGDKWIEVQDNSQVLAALGEEPKNVFLTVGSMELWQYSTAPQHRYLVRSIDEIEEKPLMGATYITARPPFTVESEKELMREFGAEYVISKNSGGSATRAKLIAARELGIPVILIARPHRPSGKQAATAKEAMAWLVEERSDD